MITLVRAVQTCEAFPSQWDAWDADGHYYYLRYRWGCGMMRRDGPTGTAVAGFAHGDGLAGEIDLGSFARLAGVKLALS